jgi:23S rRNA (guanine745-N1)-methyltransferase
MTALRCPVCKTDLFPSARSYVCSAGHSFDIARQGYVNLLLSSQRPSKAPGDNASMIADRRAFLDAHHYRPLRDCIKGRLDRLQAVRTELQILDLGCGEGYYTAAFAEGTEALVEQAARHVYALDIAKPALAIAAKRSAAVTWCVGTSRALPFHDHSLDVVLNIFCRPHIAETQRVLKEDGVLLVAGPGIDHLSELRAVLYDNVVKQESHSAEEILQGGFALLHSETLDYEFTVQGAAIGQLARMTPHYWRASQAGRERLEALTTLTTHAQFIIQEFGKQESGKTPGDDQIPPEPATPIAPTDATDGAPE